MTSDYPTTPSALSGVAEGSAVVAVLLLGLRLAGVAPLAAYAAALGCGVLTTVVLCRRRGGPEPAVGMAVVLTAAYSMLGGVLVVFVLAVLGVD